MSKPKYRIPARSRLGHGPVDREYATSSPKHAVGLSGRFAGCGPARGRVYLLVEVPILMAWTNCTWPIVRYTYRFVPQPGKSLWPRRDKS